MAKRTVPNNSAPTRFFYAADADGMPVSNPCLSSRGARRHVRRLRNRVAGVHVIERAARQGVEA